MPNWCENNLSITGDKTKILTLLVKIKDSGEFFNIVKPIPVVFLDIHSGWQMINGIQTNAWRTIGDKDVALSETEIKQLKEKYGVTTQIDWCYRNWGTKWDTTINDDLDRLIVEVQEDNSQEVTVVLSNFDTAWSPPIEIYQELEKQGFFIEAEYYESGSCFYGYYTAGADDYNEYSSYSDIPDYIKTIFAVENWEEDEETNDSNEE